MADKLMHIRKLIILSVDLNYLRICLVRLRHRLETPHGPEIGEKLKLKLGNPTKH